MSDTKVKTKVKTERYFIDSDNEGHKYLIPAKYRSKWEKWLDSSDAEDGIVPEWAKYLNTHYSRVTFSDPVLP